MIHPAPIAPGASIAIISPSSTPKAEKLRRGVEYLEKRGYKTRLGQHVQDQNKYLAGYGPEQLADLHWAFEDDDIDAIICSRGGYGTPRFLDQIDYELIASKPKLFVGYSDITALQCALMVKANLVSFSAPMVAVEMGSQEGIDAYTEEQFWKLVSNPLEGQVFMNPVEEELKVHVGGVGRGELVGGCLSLYNNLMGTPYFPDFSGKILVLEDIGENVQHIDRMLSQFKMAGMFAEGGIHGLMLGQFIDAWEKADDNDFSLDELVRDIIGEVDFPIVSRLAYGHGDRKMGLPLGAEVELNTNSGTISFV